jgi:DNA-binding transcriptional LysR family regulator
MELTQLRYFVLVAENGTTARAANQAMVSQSTVSKSLLHLEHELGQPLFERQGNRLLLNTAGGELLQQARPILAAVDRLPERVLARHRAVFRVSVTVAQPIMARFALEFLQKKPEFQLQWTHGSWIDDCDLSITAAPSGRPEDNLLLTREQVLLAVPRKFPENFALEDLPLALPGEGTALRDLVDQSFRTLPDMQNIRAVAAEGEVLRELVNSGLTASFWPQKTWPRPNPETVRLQEVPGVSLSREIYAVLPPQGCRENIRPLLEDLREFFTRSRPDPWRS